MRSMVEGFFGLSKAPPPGFAWSPLPCERRGGIRGQNLPRTWKEKIGPIRRSRRSMKLIGSVRRPA